jgi:histone acetyltransferase (RNA polymerase elongator complex component)
MPEEACPHRCVFCNQHIITGRNNTPSDQQILSIIQTYLSTRRSSVRHAEVGFFGGSFTGLPAYEMQRVLLLVQPWIERGEIQAIRISTRPDYIDEDKLMLLKQMRVQTIELGVQSHRNRVLEASGRGHSARDTQNASEMILRHGFRLGHQLMVGLPGEEEGDEVFNAETSIRLGAMDIRIYPVLVLKNTELASRYAQGVYKPLTLEEAIGKAARMVQIFEAAGRNIIKVGLHPSEQFTRGDLIAGPWHPNFRELLKQGNARQPDDSQILPQKHPPS